MSATPFLKIPGLKDMVQRAFEVMPRKGDLLQLGSRLLRVKDITHVLNGPSPILNLIDVVRKVKK